MYRYIYIARNVLFIVICFQVLYGFLSQVKLVTAATKFYWIPSHINLLD